MGSKYPGSNEEVRALSALINLMRACEALVKRAHRHLTAEKLSMTEFGVLETLFHGGPASERALEEKLLRAASSVGFTLARLQKRKLVAPQPPENSSGLWRLTPRGHELIRRVFPVHARVVAREFSVLSQVEQEQLRNLCRKLGRGN